MHTLLTLALTLAASPALPPSGSSACNAPPMPKAGQTVTWTLAGSPYEMCSNRTIPFGGAVIVEAGVQLTIRSNVRLTVAGALTGSGTPALPILFDGGDFEGIHISGDLHLDHAILRRLIVGKDEGRISFADCSFETGAQIATFAGAVHGQLPRYRFDRCTFSGGATIFVDGQAALRDVQINGSPWPVWLRGWSLLENVTIDGAPLQLGAWHAQDSLVDGVTVTNANGPGLLLEGGRNYELGPGNTLTGNSVPVEFGLEGAGLLPGSVVPTSGNAANHVLDTSDPNPASSVRWADVAVPYVVPAQRTVNRLAIDPGVEVRFAPNAGWIVEFALLAEGLPGAPIVFRRDDPQKSWGGISLAGPSERLEYCRFLGATTALIAVETTHADSCWFEGNDMGASVSKLQNIFLRSCRFTNNTVGVMTPILTEAWMGYEQNPNSFEGNTIGVRNKDQNDGYDAEHAWWGHPTGPQHPQNSGGLGDPVAGLGAGLVEVLPFRTTPLDDNDSPPVVRLVESIAMLTPGEKVIIHWEASDDQAIVEQHVLWNSGVAFDPTYKTVASGLPTSQRSIEWTVPTLGNPNNDNPVYLRVVAVDTAGQEGWDEVVVNVPDDTGVATANFALAGSYEIGGSVDICASNFSGGVLPNDAWLLLENDQRIISLGFFTGTCTVLPADMPSVSTDRARILLTSSAGLGDYYFSQPFEIRPDPMMGDAPPAVTMTSPMHGDMFTAGTLVPIRWTANDDVALRGFDILASYDGGRRWSAIVRDLAATDTGYDWRLPPQADLPDVRVRVVVKDRRFQNSSDGDDRVLTVIPATGFGTSYCGPAIANSTGLPARISGSGSEVAADNDVTLFAGDLPPQQFGYFLASQTQDFVTAPGGSMGNLCLGGNIARFTKRVQNSGAGGSFSIKVDLTSIPLSPPQAVQAGETWNFQAWFRDKNPQQTSNFTNGLSVLFK